MAWNKPAGDDLENLFINDLEAQTGTSAAPASNPPAWEAVSAVPAQATRALPIRQQQALQAQAVRGETTPGAGMQHAENTIDETDIQSLMREGGAIWRNLKLVCNPLMKPEEVSLMLQHWDLWGPLIFTLLLASLLSMQSSGDKMEISFTVVFIVVIAGALLLTANVILLGGSVSFFQSVSLLGYCMFPLDIAALVCVLVDNTAVRVIFVGLALLWAMRASVPFVGGSVGDKRRFLAVFPLTLMYAVLGWLTYIS